MVQTITSTKYDFYFQETCLNTCFTVRFSNLPLQIYHEVNKYAEFNKGTSNILKNVFNGK